MKQDYDFTKAKRVPVLPAPPGKTRITIRIDDDVLDWFRKSLTRSEKRHGKGKALSILAHKFGRAAYYMLLRGKAFEIARFVAPEREKAPVMSPKIRQLARSIRQARSSVILGRCWVQSPGRCTRSWKGRWSAKPRRTRSAEGSRTEPRPAGLVCPLDRERPHRGWAAVHSHHQKQFNDWLAPCRAAGSWHHHQPGR